MNPLEVLIEARGLIARHGWIQFACGSEQEGFCLFGAVEEAARRFVGDSALSHEVRMRSLALIKRFGFKDDMPRSITGWNDSLGQNVAAVLQVLDDTIATLRTAQSVPE